MPYAEIMFISAKTGQRLPKLFDMIDFVIANHAMRIETGVVNEIMAEAVALQQHLQIRVRDLNFIILHRFLLNRLHLLFL